MEDSLTCKQRRAIPLILVHHALKMTEVEARLDVPERGPSRRGAGGSDGRHRVLLHRPREGYVRKIAKPSNFVKLGTHQKAISP